MGFRRVLVVDDNVELAENIAEILALDGHRTDVAATAEEALEKLPAGQPDVLVTDYRLPGMNGVQLVRAFRESGLRARAVVISAYCDDSTVNAAEAEGAAFIAKPLDFGALSQFVRDAN